MKTNDDILRVGGGVASSSVAAGRKLPLPNSSTTTPNPPPLFEWGEKGGRTGPEPDPLKSHSFLGGSHITPRSSQRKSQGWEKELPSPAGGKTI